MNRVSSSSDGQTFFSRSSRPQISSWNHGQHHPGLSGIITEPVTLPEPKLLPPATAPVANGRKDAMVLLETGATESVLPNTKLRNGQRWQVAGLAVPTWTCIYL